VLPARCKACVTSAKFHQSIAVNSATTAQAVILRGLAVEAQQCLRSTCATSMVRQAHSHMCTSAQAGAGYSHPVFYLSQYIQRSRPSGSTRLFISVFYSNVLHNLRFLRHQKSTHADMGRKDRRSQQAKTTPQMPQSNNNDRTIKVYAVTPGWNIIARTISAEKLVQHSRLAEQKLEHLPGKRRLDRIDVAGVTPEAQCGALERWTTQNQRTRQCNTSSRRSVSRH